MAKQLIADMTDKWKPDAYSDKFTDAIHALVAKRQKAGATKTVEPMEETEEGGQQHRRPYCPAGGKPGEEAGGAQGRAQRRQGHLDQQGAQARLTSMVARSSSSARESHPRIGAGRGWPITGRNATSRRPASRAASNCQRGKALSFVIQKHAARRLHYDFRLELDGVLVSWAVPKGPSYDPADKRLAVHVEDHPLSYGSFEGTIPPKQYGAGTVIVWDKGTWEPIGDPHQGLKKGKLAFTLHGQKMSGLWELVKIAKDGEKQEPWLLFKKRDEFARPHDEYDVVSALPDSVIAKPIKPRLRQQVRLRKARRAPRLHRGGMPQGAVRAALPKQLSPQLATLVEAPAPEGEWIYEIKFDGYRIMARVEKGKVAHDHPRWPRLVLEDAAAGRRAEATGHRLGLAGRRDRRAGRERHSGLQRAAEGLRQRRRKPDQVLPVRPALLRGLRPARRGAGRAAPAC